MNAYKLPECLKESCASLGIEEPEKIRQILAHLQAVHPMPEAPAEPTPELLTGIRDWATHTISRHQVDMGRVSVAIWFSWKLSLWKPEHASLDHYYKDGCGFSPAQGDRLRHHGAVLVALTLAEVPQMPTEKQARVTRNVIPDHFLGNFFRAFFATHDRTVHYDAGATKRAAQRYAEHQVLIERQRALALTEEGAASPTSPSIPSSVGPLESVLPEPTSPNSPAQKPPATQSLGDLERLLELVAPGVTLEEFLTQCVDVEFRRIRKEIDSIECAELPLLDGLTEKSPRHAEAVWRLFRPKVEAFLKHLTTRESRHLLKQAVKTELVEKAAEVPTVEPMAAVAPKVARKNSQKKKPTGVDTTPELPFDPDPLTTPAAFQPETPTASAALIHETQSNQIPNHE